MAWGRAGGEGEGIGGGRGEGSYAQDPSPTNRPH